MGLSEVDGVEEGGVGVNGVDDSGEEAGFCVRGLEILGWFSFDQVSDDIVENLI